MKYSPIFKSSGFTLIELMVVVAVLGLLASIAIPSFQSILASQRMRSVAFDMMTDLLFARSEAIKRGENVVLAPATGGWTSGWTVRVSSSSELVSQKPGVGSSVTFLSSPASVTYDQNGRVSNISSSANFALTDGTRNRCISIDPSGRPKSSLAGCAL